ncbi:MAG: hypothetical protein RLZZ115_3516 [Cyanobacteriota bacterium]|jgi:hypothetical protein
MKNNLTTSSKQVKDAKVIEILVETYPSVQPKFTKLNWSGGEGDGNA